jgi:hypothetical protein
MAFMLYRLLEKFFITRMNVTFATPASLKIDPRAKTTSMKEFCDPEQQENATGKLRSMLR